MKQPLAPSLRLSLPLLALCQPSLADEPIGFHAQVLPVLRARCQGCHQDGKAKGKVNLSSYQSLMQATKKLVVAGEPDESLLVEVITSSDGAPPEMPKKALPLAERDVALIRQWILEGAREGPTATAEEASFQGPAERANPPVVNSLD